MVRMWILSGVVMLAGCQCNHLIGTNAVDAGGGGAGSDASCGSEAWDGGGIICPYGDLIALEHQPCSPVGQTCQAYACTQDVCSMGCFQGVCDSATHAWKGSKATPAQCSVDAGQCKYATECSSVISATCAFGTGAVTAPSCIHRQCVEECPGARICEVSATDAGVCLNCGGMPNDCAARCGQTQPGTVVIGDIHCKPGFDAGTLSAQTGWQPTIPASCEYQLGTLGRMTHLTSSHSVADFPELGGTCVGRNLFTGVQRTQWYCPACTFVMEGWD